MTNITKLPAIIHGEGKDEGKLFTRLDERLLEGTKFTIDVHKDGSIGAMHGLPVYLYSVSSPDFTMYHVFRVQMTWQKGDPSAVEFYPETKDFGRTAFGVADLADAEKLFEKLADA